MSSKTIFPRYPKFFLITLRKPFLGFFLQFGIILVNSNRTLCYKRKLCYSLETDPNVAEKVLLELLGDAYPRKIDEDQGKKKSLKALNLNMHPEDLLGKFRSYVNVNVK